MGKGVGKKLLKYAINSCRVRYVDVNEQNEQAYGFYRHLGFKVIGRDATDASGEPYPILHLKLKENMKIENWGTVPYSEAWERQTVLFNALVEAKQEGNHTRTESFCGTSTCLYVGEERKRCEYVVG